MAAKELFKYNKFYSTIDRHKINNFTIYGERHSGTNWLEKLITNSFNIPITWKYDYKHFFGCCDWEVLNKAQNTLFIGIYRNIYNWIGGMKKMPYHLESNKVLDIKPWQSVRGISKYNSFCDSHWYTKEKYKDIFDMRHNKLEFLYLYMPYLVDNYVLIKYEDLIEHTYDIVNMISVKYNLNIVNKKYAHPDKSKLSLYKLSQNNIIKINDNTIWTTETLVGYKMINTIDREYRLY